MRERGARAGWLAWGKQERQRVRRIALLSGILAMGALGCGRRAARPVQPAGAAEMSAEALRAIAHAGQRKGTPALVGHLSAASPAQRMWAAFGLARLAALSGAAPVDVAWRAQVVPIVRKALTAERDAHVRRQLLHALGVLGGPIALDVVFAQTRGPVADATAAFDALAAAAALDRVRAGGPLDVAIEAGLARSEGVQRAALRAARAAGATLQGAAALLSRARDAEVRALVFDVLPTNTSLDVLKASLTGRGPWRVMFAALRWAERARAAGQPVPDAWIRAAGNRAAERVQRGGAASPWNHVLGQACRAFWPGGAAAVTPGEAVAWLGTAQRTAMAAGGRHAACGCAARLWAVTARDEDLQGCSATDASLARVDGARVARISTAERRFRLGAALRDERAVVRAAAWKAMFADGRLVQQVGERALTEQALHETDPALRSALLEGLGTAGLASHVTTRGLAAVHGQLLQAGDAALAGRVEAARLAHGRAEAALSRALNADAAPEVRAVLRTGSVLDRVARPAGRAAIREEGALLVRVETPVGDARIALEPALAPQGVRAWRDTLAAGAWRDARVAHMRTGVHVLLSPAKDPLGVGQTRVHDEPAPGGMRRGAVVRLSGLPDAPTAAYTVLLSDAPELEGRATRVGRVVSGLDVLSALHPGDTVALHGISAAAAR